MFEFICLTRKPAPHSSFYQVATKARSKAIEYFAYDLAGNLARIADSGNGDILFGYDELDRPTQVVTDQGTVGYTYDAPGRRTQRSIDGTDPTTYTWDQASRITAIDYRGKTVG